MRASQGSSAVTSFTSSSSITSERRNQLEGPRNVERGHETEDEGVFEQAFETASAAPWHRRPYEAPWDRGVRPPPWASCLYDDAREQLRPELVFEVRECRRDGRLRDERSPGCRADAAFSNTATK